MKIRTALIHDAFIPTMNSTTVTIRNYATWLNEKYGSSIVVAPTISNYIDIEAFDVMRYKGSNMFLKDLSNDDIDLVHTFTPFNFGQFALKYARSHNIPIVASLNHDLLDHYNEEMKLSFFEQLKFRKVINFYNKVDALLIPDKKILTTLQVYGFKGKAELIQAGTDFEFVHSNNKNREYVNHKHEISNETRVLLYVGKLHWRRNLKLLIETLQNLKRLKQDFRMFFIGDGNARDEMIKLINELKLNKYVIFTGTITDRNLLKKYYERADLLLFPSVHLSSYQVIIEAASFQLPALIIKDTMMSQKIKDYYNGYLSENNSLSYAQKIIASLNDKNKVNVGVHAQNTLAIRFENIVDELYLKYYKMKN